MRGSSHERTGRACEDAHGVVFLDPDTVVLAVADGAGSAEFAKEGSSLAVEAVLRRVSQVREAALESSKEFAETLREAVEVAREELLQRAEQKAVDVGALATTLVAVIASRDRVCAVQIGDGAAVVEVEGNGLTSLTRPQGEGYANETVFLTSETAIDSMQSSSEYGPIVGVALLSDGLQWLALEMPRGEPFRGFFKPLLTWAAEAQSDSPAAEDLEAFLRSRKIRAKTDDDVTIVLAARKTRES